MRLTRYTPGEYACASPGSAPSCDSPSFGHRWAVEPLPSVALAFRIEKERKKTSKLVPSYIRFISIYRSFELLPMFDSDEGNRKEKKRKEKIKLLIMRFYCVKRRKEVSLCKKKNSRSRR